MAATTSNMRSIVGRMMSILTVSFALNLCLISLQQMGGCSAFNIGSERKKGLLPQQSQAHIGVSERWRSKRCMSVGDSIATGETTAIVEDQNGKAFEVGAIVRVVTESKAYQVPVKGFGSFNEDKEFVAAPEDAPRGTKNLVLPVGMRGVVTKVYDIDDISANFPIQVKFMPGKNTEEGYDPPVAFIMHFDTFEIECV